MSSHLQYPQYPYSSRVRVEIEELWDWAKNAKLENTDYISMFGISSGINKSYTVKFRKEEDYLAFLIKFSDRLI